MSSEEIQDDLPYPEHEIATLSNISLDMDAYIADMEETAEITKRGGVGMTYVSEMAIKNMNAAKDSLDHWVSYLKDYPEALESEVEEPSFKENYSWLMKRYPDLAPRMKEILLKSSYGLK